MKPLKLIECPRDAMQGIRAFIPTDLKIKYLSSLLQVGFDTLDCGSFVSAKAIPQMQDTAQVLEAIASVPTQTQLLTIVANTQGAQQAVAFPQIQYLGYPFSISENFQMRNTHKTIAESMVTLQEILQLAQQHHKEVVAYLSMGFGNPYGDPWHPDIVADWTQQLSDMGIRIISLSDTIGSATPALIGELFASLIPQHPQVAFGAHLHSLPHQVGPKMEAAWQAGCRRFDGALKGMGGCPMAKDELTGNMPTEGMLDWIHTHVGKTSLDLSRLTECLAMADAIFGQYH